MIYVHYANRDLQSRAWRGLQSIKSSIKSFRVQKLSSGNFPSRSWLMIININSQSEYDKMHMMLCRNCES